MEKKHLRHYIKDLIKIFIGCAVFALGFDLFLEPNHMNVGGVSGVGQLVAFLSGFGSVALWSLLINIPLFIMSIKGVGREFFVGSLIGMLALNFFLELFTHLPVPDVQEPLLAVLYGGLLTGAGGGLVLTAGASTGGVDIVARMLRPKFPMIPIGKIMMFLDIITVTLTGIVFQDINKALYSAVTLYVSSIAMDAVVYGLDYSTVAMVISDAHDAIGKKINEQLDRGVTLLDGHGFYSGSEKQVLLSVIKKNQMGELKQIVTEIDPDAFIILQEAHQVLGEGFKYYNKNEL